MIYILQTISKQEALITKESIEKYNPKSSVKILNEPYSLIGSAGIISVPTINQCDKSCFICTDKILCKGNIEKFISKNNPTVSFNCGMDLNTCYYKYDAADSLDVCGLFNPRDLGYYARNQNLIFDYLNNNFDFRKIFKYKTSVLKAEKTKPTERKKKKRKWWFGK
jgi:hypothetical protein